MEFIQQTEDEMVDQLETIMKNAKKQRVDYGCRVRNVRVGADVVSIPVSSLPKGERPLRYPLACPDLCFHCYALSQRTPHIV